MGKCTNCGGWDTITEFRQPKKSGSRQSGVSGNKIAREAVDLSSCKPERIKRRFTGFPEVDRVLGGGLVPGSMVLVGGNPGIGKSTLMLHTAAHFTQKDSRVLYVSGEESLEQLSLRSQRLGIAAVPISVLTETSVERVLDTMDTMHPDVVILDSIQTIFSEELESAPGSVSQVRECTAMLMRRAKESQTALFLVGHVTKEGAIAGPRVIEHMVDTVLYFEGDSSFQYRILRAIKNRFGPSGEIALLAMTDSGLREVSNASEFFLMHRDVPQVGTAVAPVLEGSRILVVELQALVNRSHFGLPQRVASGINPKKLSLLLAVLERYAGVSLGDHDIFFNVAGGLSIAEPAIDLSIAASVLSSFRNIALGKGIACIGEIGLGGEIRPVNSMLPRLRELAGMGFTRCVVPVPPRRSDWAEKNKGIELIMCRSVNDLGDKIF
jgi:DNA repair protein RadA/Sms